MGAVVWGLHLGLETSDLSRLQRLAILIPAGGLAYVVFLALGDVLRLWRGTMREMLGAVRRLAARG